MFIMVFSFFTHYNEDIDKDEEESQKDSKKIQATSFTHNVTGRAKEVEQSHSRRKITTRHRRTPSRPLILSSNLMTL